MDKTKTVRRGSSATFSKKPISKWTDNVEATQFLQGEDGETQSLYPTGKKTSRDGVERRDLSRWLQPVGVVLGMLVLAIIAFTSCDTLLRSSNLQFDVYNLFYIGGNRKSSHGIGIELHPANHVFRSQKTITHYWTITKDSISPDGVSKKVYMVNGEFPGPTLQCRSGDRMIIHVTNSLVDEDVSIHWHGLRMRNANLMDGAVGFTQCPIPAGRKFTYDFDIDHEQSGTFWWHAHAQSQRGDGMYGGLVIHKPVGPRSDMELYGYKKEVLLLVGDWYHRSGAEVLDWFTSVRAFGNEPVPDSLLLNGVGKFSCSMAVPARPVECVEQPEQALGLQARGTTRIRIVNVGTLAGFTIRAGSGSFQPITIDGGNLVEGRSVESVGIIYPGERVDLLSKWDASPSPPRLHISLDRENLKYPNPALRPDQSFPILLSADHYSNNSIEEPIPLIGENHFDLAFASASLSSKDQEVPLASTAQQTILLYTKTQKLSINANHPQGFMNRTSWRPQSPALISLPRTSWDSNQLIPFIPSNTSSPPWVDIIINNLDDGSHPFHLHGHAFYVLASHRSEHGWGSYSPWATTGSSAIAPKLNLENPVLKDTVSVPRRGYVVLRFRADNVGIWMFHCHVLFHQGSGMAMGLHVGAAQAHEDVDARGSQFCTQSD
ncbi:Diphenol oxidase 1 [Hyphodiscus hymeniophilus]|uniref:Diphenol oxidase 1 n=1 Tax=Hyphodiscus hymeniophilus TaxID=353542 RepID=A0A9P7AZ65_9HELO|nr:Diphenol oxidase 1 [Hyphodiscus hymeniophilus]